MPTLADIYSYIDTQKRKAAGAIRSPLSTLQEMAALAGDEARQINRETALSSQGRRQEMVGQPMSPEQESARQALLERVGEAALGGMTVWHGSPYKFTAFDPKKIGTGEGAQSYGHGLYVAENPSVAKEYQSSTSKNKFLTPSGVFDPSELEHLNVRATIRNEGLDKAIEIAKKYGSPDADYPETAAKAARDLAKLENLKAGGGIQKNVGNLYKIDLPDEHIEKMLDWDKRISKQPQMVQDAWQTWQQSKEGQKVRKQLLAQRSPQEVDRMLADPTGEAMHKWIYEGYGSLKGGENPKVAKFLKSQGLAGVKYEDAGSRTVMGNRPTRNFVIFPGNESMLRILDINDNPIK